MYYPATPLPEMQAPMPPPAASEARWSILLDFISSAFTAAAVAIVAMCCGFPYWTQVEKTKKGVRNLGLWTDCYYKGGVVTCNDPPFPEAQNDSCTGLYSGAAAMSILGCVFLLFSLGCLFPIACNAVPRYRVMIVRYCTILNIFLGTAFSTVSWVLWLILTSKDECGAVGENDTCWTLTIVATALAFVGLFSQCGATRYYSIEESGNDYAAKEMVAQLGYEQPVFYPSYSYPSY